ncbi:MAG: efflux RND transporter permease subunit [Roseiarcus sp.]|jgi:multidrug efflux pump subunit AcrB
MAEGVSGPFIRHPVATTLIMVAILLAGVVAYPLLPVAPLPQMDFPTITISASLPGASPDTMASSVAQPLERQIAQIPGVTQMTSTSSLGATGITVQFDLDRNIDAAANDIQAAINAASGQLPKNLPSAPTYRKVNPSDAPILILSVASDTAPIIDVDDAAENILAQQISQIAGVSLVRVGGQQQPAVRIQIDPAKLVEKNLQLEDIRGQVAVATTDSPKGAVNGVRQTFTIFDNDQLVQAKAWNDVIVAYRNGAPVRIRDIGKAVDGPADDTQAAWGNGKRDVFLVVFKQPGVNVIKTVDNIKRTMTRLEASIPAVLRHRFATLMAFLVTVAATVYLFVAIPKGFFPQQDTGVLFGTSDAPQDISFAEMMKRQQELGAIVQADPGVASVAMALGAGVGNSAQNSGRMFITLKPREERTADAFQIVARLRPKLAQVKGARLFLQVAQDVTVGARAARSQFQYTLQDANLDELNLWAPKILDKFRSLPALRDVATDQQNAGATLHLTIDRDMASRFGIQPQLIDDTLYDAYGQRQVAQYFTQVNTYDVVEEIRPDLQGDPKSLDLIYIRSPSTGQMVPLSAFAKWTTTPVAPLSISHQSQFPAVTISFNLSQGAALSDATAAIQQAKRDLRLPPGLTTTFQGNAQAFQDSLTTVPLLILAALVVVYIILGVLYESFIHPLTILSTLPSAGFGALATLMAFGYEFSLIALIGLILLIGIVKKNGIMMVDFAIAVERDEHLTTEQSIRKAALLRFRPIMMTTMAAMLGGVPLMLGQGTGSELRQPLGYTMVGGLLFSQALTLFTTPVIYLYLDQLSNWLWRSAKHPEAALAPTTEDDEPPRHADRREAAE